MGDTDPYYARKPVPNEFIENVGYTGLKPADELGNRERKLSSTVAGDLRKFSNPKIKGGKLDPFYQRKPVPDELIKDVGETGLTREEEFDNRERKFSVGGQDVRKFSTGGKTSLKPKDDPYYGRKPVEDVKIENVAPTGLSKAEEFEIRENKESLFDLSKDPFAEITGRGHRASVSGPVIAAAAGEARRRSSVAPHHVAEAHHSGYHGGNALAPIESRTGEDQITPSSSTTGGINHTGPTTTTTTTTTTATHTFPGNSVPVTARDDTGHLTGPTGHTQYYDSATTDVGPHGETH